MTQNQYGYGYSYNYGKTGNTWSTAKTVQSSNNIRCVSLPNPSKDTITQLEFSREGDPLLAASSWDQTIRIWKFDDWSYQHPTYLDGIKEPTNAILRFCFDKNCTKIYYGTTAGEIKVFDFTNKQGTGASPFGAGLGASGAGTGAFGGGMNSYGAKYGNYGSGLGAYGGASGAYGGSAGAYGGANSSLKNAGNAAKPGGFQYSGYGGAGAFGKGATSGYGTFGASNKIPLNILDGNNNPTEIPPSQYIVSGLKWNNDYKIIVALTSNGYDSRPYPHSLLGFVDPDNPKICILHEMKNYKIINIDSTDDRVYFITINAQDGSPSIGFAEFRNFQQTIAYSSPFQQIRSQINSMPTSISVLPQGHLGYLVTTIQGFVEYNFENENIYFYDGIYRVENAKNLEVYPANCSAVAQFDRKIGIVCSRNELTTFILETSEYKTQIPITTDKPTKDSITACALSPGGDSFACAYGYDWSKGADGMEKNKTTPLILVGATPEPPKKE